MGGATLGTNWEGEIGKKNKTESFYYMFGKGTSVFNKY